jgi:hypothetical protein
MERAIRAAERALCLWDIPVALRDGPFGFAGRTLPMQLHAIVMNGVLQANAA